MQLNDFNISNAMWSKLTSIDTGIVAAALASSAHRPSARATFAGGGLALYFASNIVGRDTR